jgi:hypothetical protein
MTDHDRLLALLATRSARRGQFTLASGRRSSLYIDARLTTMSPDGLSQRAVLRVSPRFGAHADREALLTGASARADHRVRRRRGQVRSVRVHVLSRRAVRSHHRLSSWRDPASCRCQPRSRHRQHADLIRGANALVASSSPSLCVRQYIHGLYNGAVAAGAAAVPDYVPNSWAQQNRAFYLDVMRKNCVMCHHGRPDQPRLRRVGEFSSTIGRWCTTRCARRGRCRTPSSRSSGSGRRIRGMCGFPDCWRR